MVYFDLIWERTSTFPTRYTGDIYWQSCLWTSDAIPRPCTLEVHALFLLCLFFVCGVTDDFLVTTSDENQTSGFVFGFRRPPTGGRIAIRYSASLCECCLWLIINNVAVIESFMLVPLQSLM